MNFITRAFCCSLILCTNIAWGFQEEKTEAEFTAQQLEFFENEVRPILVNRCYECHSGLKIEGGLNLESRNAILSGGDFGPAIEVGDPDESLMIDAVNYGDFYEMPPKSKLPQEEIDILTKWVVDGAAWPATDDVAKQVGEVFDLASRKTDHWCWQSVMPPELPDVADDWAIDPLDTFVQHQVETAGLKVAPQADQATLLRRVCFDLIGLPPSEEQIQSFVMDQSVTFEQIVDELLKSPHFGERWARHWMDLTRFAETFGHEFDYPIRHAFQYRDYLIRAFNQDVPYDQFVREHIAGDLITNPRRHQIHQYNESILGTGFWFLGEATHGPVDVKGDEAGRVDNQIDVMTKTFLGLTVACARCHDHKFDAISTRDYYSLAGFLQSSRRQETMLDVDAKIENSLKRIRPLHLESLKTLTGLGDALGAGDPDMLAKYLVAAVTVSRSIPKTDDSNPAKPLRSPKDVAAEMELELETLDRVIASLQSPAIQSISHPLHSLLPIMDGEIAIDETLFKATNTRVAQQADAATQSRNQAVKFADFDSTDHGWYRTGFAFADTPEQYSFIEQEGTEVIPPGVLNSGAFGGRFFGVIRSPTFEITHPNIHIRVRSQNTTIRLVIDGYIMDEFNALLFGDAMIKSATHNQFEWRTQRGDIKKYIGHRAHIEIIDRNDGFAAIDEIWFSDGPGPIDPPSHLSTINAESKNLTGFCQNLAQQVVSLLGDSKTGHHIDRSHLLTWVINDSLFTALQKIPSRRVRVNLSNHSLTAEKLASRLRELRDQISTISNETPHPKLAIAIEDGNGENEFVFVRGNHKTLGLEAKRQFLEALVGDDSKRFTELSGSGRMKLANQIADRNNPLTSRVIVNRIWHHLTGRGIVASVDNFGVLGSKPTNPQLLDYLANEFVEDGWSIKSMIRRIVTSRTYQMSSQLNPQAFDIDPDNELMHRARIRRLQGEVIRDSILFASGELDRKLFGPSVKIHLTPFMQGRGRPGADGPLDGNRRRSIYTEVRRNFLSPMMLAFDTPIPFNSTGRRNLSNVPSQALILMNDPFVVEQARKWATRLSREEQSDLDRIKSIYLAAFGRQPTEQETDLALEFVSAQAKEMGLANDSPEAWADFCHVIFNVKEFIYLK